MDKRMNDQEDGFDRLVNLIAVIFGLALLALAIWSAYREYTRPVRERADWNMGYYGVNADEAYRMAKLGFGKTTEDILADYRARKEAR